MTKGLQLLFCFSVILAPYGIAATLTGQSYRETDHNTQKFMDEWRQFYVLPDWDRVDGVSYLESGHVAPAVEVVVGELLLNIFSVLPV